MATMATTTSAMTTQPTTTAATATLLTPTPVAATSAMATGPTTIAATATPLTPTPMATSTAAAAQTITFGYVKFRKIHPEYRDSFDGDAILDKWVKTWSVKGKVNEIWGSLKGCLEDMLKQKRSDKRLQPPEENPSCSPPLYQLRCFLVGTSKERASPHVAVCCAYRWFAKGVKSLILESQILGKGQFEHFKACFVVIAQIVQPGPATGLKWGSLTSSETECELSLHTNNLSETLCGGKVSKMLAGTLSQVATVGGTVRIGHRYLGMTVAHNFQLDPQIAPPIAEATSDDSIDFNELDLITSDEEDSDDDYPSFASLLNDSAFIHSTKKEYEIDPLEGILPALLSTEIGTDTKIQRKRSLDHVVKLGHVWELSKYEDGNVVGRNLDWALINIENPALHKPNFVQLPIAIGGGSSGFWSHRALDRIYEQSTSVILQTSHGPVIGSSLCATSSLKIPSFDEFQPVWMLHINGVQPGDCGSWAFETSSGDLIGMLIGACHTLREAYILPACYIFEEIRKMSGYEVELPESIFANPLEPLLNVLPYATDASFNSYSMQHKPYCLPGTRVDLLMEIYKWADGQDDQCIFWLNGLAGTGKSAITRTVARRCFEQGCLAASFFFSKGSGDISHADKFVTSIAIQLTQNIPGLYQYIYNAVRDRRDIANQPLRDQWQQLILRPLSELDSHSYHSSYVLVVDALDECEDNNSIQTIIRLLDEARSLHKIRLKIFLASRPELSIRYGFRQILDMAYREFVLHHVSHSTINHDIFLFLEHNLRVIREERCLDAEWPGIDVIERLVQNASGLFIWAVAACQFIREGARFAVKRLDMIIQNNTNAITAPDQYVNEICTSVLKLSINPNFTDEEREYQYRMLRYILGCTAVSFAPIPISSLSRLLFNQKEVISQTLEDLHAILDIPEDGTRPLRLYHPSFRDFLLNEERCKDPNFWVNAKSIHQKLADSCIQLMLISLRRDICSVGAPGVRVVSIERSRVEQSLSPELQYACLYWIQHLQESGAQLFDNSQVHQFLKDHLLHWLEALSWMRRVSEGIYAISSLESITVVRLP